VAKKRAAGTTLVVFISYPIRDKTNTTAVVNALEHNRVGYFSHHWIIRHRSRGDN
jgi:hypothetical protein